MANGKREQEWAQTSNVCAILANANRDHKKRSTPFTPYDFLPSDLRLKIGMPRERKFTVGDLHSLRAMFPGSSGS